MMENKNTISLILAVYNEADCVKKTIYTLKHYMEKTYPDRTWDIIVVDDGSKDETFEILQNIASELSIIKLFKHSKNMGQGKAFQTAFNNVSKDIAVTLDADLSYSENYIDKMITEVEDKNADIVIASAFKAGIRIKNVPLSRRIMTICANKLLRLSSSLDISAITCAVRAYKFSSIKYLPLSSHGMEVNLEIILKAEIFGLHIEEIPAVLEWKTSKQLKTQSTNRKKRRSTFSLIKTIFRYSFFSFLFNPGLVFVIPQFFFIPVFLIYLFSLGSNIIVKFMDFLNQDSVTVAISEALNWSYTYHQRAYVFALGSLFCSLIMFLIWFISKQNKFYFEQNHIMFTTLLKKQEEILTKQETKRIKKN